MGPCGSGRTLPFLFTLRLSLCCDHVGSNRVVMLSVVHFTTFVVALVIVVSSIRQMSTAWFMVYCGRHLHIADLARCSLCRFVRH